MRVLSATEEPGDTAQEQPELFRGIDPDDTTEVKVGGAVFTIGVIDQGVWGRLYAESGLAHEAAKRRAIKRLADEGVDPDEVVDPDSEGNGVTRMQIAAYGDPVFREAHYRVQCEAVRHAVRTHQGLVKRDGTPIPLKHSTAKGAFGELEVVAEETMRFYRANPVLVERLWLPILRMQTLGEAEKKV